MKPNIPDQHVKAVLVDKNIAPESIDLLSKHDITVYKTVKLEKINDCTSTHPDMQLVKISETDALVAREALDYYRRILPMFNYTAVDGIKSPYPNDSKLNFTIVGNHVFAAKHHLEHVKDQYEVIKINQGYSKCNICVLSKNSIITSDSDIIKNAEKFGFTAYYLPCDDILLKGYKNGFWGGCSGLISNDKLFFNGNIEEMSCYNDLINVLSKEKIEPVYQTETTLSDNGSIIPIY